MDLLEGTEGGGGGFSLAFKSGFRLGDIREQGRNQWSALDHRSEGSHRLASEPLALMHIDCT